LKRPRVVGLCVLGLLLLFCAPSTWIGSALGADTIGPVYLGIIVSDVDYVGDILHVYADETFSVTLRVTREPAILRLAFGYLYLDSVPFKVDADGGSFDIRFAENVFEWESSPIAMSLSAGKHTLRFQVDYGYDSTPPGTDYVETSILAQTCLPTYTVEWLHEPDESIRAGKLIRFRFSIRNELGLFVPSDDVRIVVDGPIEEPILATCGKRSGSIRINENREYYSWYWKTERDLQEGEYIVSVLLDDANLIENSIQITIVS